MLNFIRRLVAGKDLDALDRYRVACREAERWNASLTMSAETAKWIREYGEGTGPLDSCEFRQRLIENVSAAAMPYTIQSMDEGSGYSRTGRLDVLMEMGDAGPHFEMTPEIHDAMHKGPVSDGPTTPPP